jgi:hypothetical protein
MGRPLWREDGSDKSLCARGEPGSDTGRSSSCCLPLVCLLGYNALQSSESQTTFRRNMSLQSSEMEIEIQQGGLFLLTASYCFLAQLILRHWRWRRYVPPKRLLISDGLHGVIPQYHCCENLESCTNYFQVSGNLLGTRFTMASCLAYFSPLKMEATCSSETSVDFQRITRRYIPEERTQFTSCFAWF